MNVLLETSIGENGCFTCLPSFTGDVNLLAVRSQHSSKNFILVLCVNPCEYLTFLKNLESVHGRYH